MFILLGVYLFVGCLSAVTNLGKWLFNNIVIGIIFMPFMVTYYLLAGTADEKILAKKILKACFSIGVMYLIVVGIIMLIQKI